MSRKSPYACMCGIGRWLSKFGVEKFGLVMEECVRDAQPLVLKRKRQNLSTDCLTCVTIIELYRNIVQIWGLVELESQGTLDMASRYGKTVRVVASATA